ncbi:MAG: hypothetical protein NTY79_08485 [Chloroflexi bacterium]|nr:hypothetical protein [Chloroflexota bacterium]
MLKLPNITVATIIYLFVIFVMLSCTPNANVSKVTGGDFDTLLSALDKSDFTLKPALLFHVDPVKLYEAGRLANSAGNNAGAPYKGLFGAGSVNVEMTDIKQLSDAQNTIDNLLYNTPGLIQGWQMNPDEAVVLAVKTPPECTYFSYCGFIFYKYYEKERQRKWVWTSFNDPLNNLTIKTSGTPGGVKGNPFNQDTIIIITADRGTDQRIRSAAISAGYSESIINTYVVPSSMVRLGTGPEFDTIVVAQRMALFADEKAGQKYVNTVMAGIKVTPKSAVKLDSFPAPELRVRGTGKTEIDLQPALEELRKAILAKYSDLAVQEPKTYVWLSESYDAVQTETYVAGESRDTVYLRSDTLTLGNDPNEFVIVYGVNHAATGKATYANCTFYGEAAWNGVTGIYSTEYAGSAEQYLPGNPLAKYLYVCKFARASGSEKACVAVPTGPKAHGVALDEPAFIGFRAYMEPATKVGPVNTELLYDRAIKFSASK